MSYFAKKKLINFFNHSTRFRMVIRNSCRNLYNKWKDKKLHYESCRICNIKHEQIVNPVRQQKAEIVVFDDKFIKK